jgi:hypothetical protein
MRNDTLDAAFRPQRKIDRCRLRVTPTTSIYAHLEDVVPSAKNMTHSVAESRIDRESTTAYLEFENIDYFTAN